MTPLNDLLGKHTPNKSTYTSCIKIGGVPILPPLVTLEKQIELQEYKKKAIDIERRLTCQRHLKLFIEQLPDSSNTKISNNTKRVTRTLENLLTFNSDDSHIDALNLTDTQMLPSEDCKTSVPLLDQNRKPSKLTRNIFDVTQYSDDGVVLFNEYNQSGLLSTASTSEKLIASIVELDLTSVSGTDNSKDIMCNSSKKITESTKEADVSTETLNVTPRDGSKPRLLRSNSYTLEAPSPILVEHFKKQAELDPAFDKYLGQKRRSLDLGNSSCEICTALDTEKQKSMSSIDLNYFATNDTDDTLKGCDIPVENISELVEGLAVLHFGTNKSNLGLNQNIEKHEETGPKLSEDIEKNTEMLQLDDMPKACAKDILDFLDRHTSEQELKLESYAKFKQQLLDQNINSNDVKNDAPELHQESPQLQHDQSEKHIPYFDEESKSCTINYLPSPNDTILNTSNSLLIDFESDTEPIIFFDCKSNHCDVGSEQLDLLTGPNEYQRSSTSLRHSRSANCSRELFSEKPDKVQQRLKEQWAGTILTAAARGYLVRRLKRTERAKNLIQTIRDAVVCAMGLHAEDTEAIQPSDVELHRRLIQQISAACYEFYNIFFGLTLKEQMAMIAMDRQKLQEKLKRPRSSSSLKSDSSKSTSRVQNRSFSARQRKSLTPSFAA